MYVSVCSCLCVYERERVCVCERERERACVCARMCKRLSFLSSLTDLIIFASVDGKTHQLIGLESEGKFLTREYKGKKNMKNKSKLR